MIASGKPIQSKPMKQSHQSTFFLWFFYYLFSNRNKLSMAVKRTEQNRTEQSYHYSHGRIPKLLYPVPFKLTYHCSKTTQRVTLMQTFKQITATQVTADSRWMIMKNISLTICAMPVLHKSQVRFVNIRLIFFLFGEFDFVRLPLVRMYKIQVKKNPSKP